MLSATLKPTTVLKGVIAMSGTMNTLEVYQGTSKDYELSIWDLAKNLPHDITGARITFVVKLDPDDEEPRISKSTDTDDGITVVDAENGVARIRLDVADTQDLKPRTYLYEVKVASADPLLVDYPITKAPLIIRGALDPFLPPP